MFSNQSVNQSKTLTLNLISLDKYTNCEENSKHLV